MTDHPMTWALAGRMAVWTILILLAMFGVGVLIGRLLQRVGYNYPEPTEDEQGELEPDYAYRARSESGIRRGVVIDRYPLTPSPTLIPGASAPIGSSEWQERARRAEALGFMDDEPKRTA